MSHIELMLRFGNFYRIHLDCGHSFQLTKSEVKLRQLYIDKRVGCEACERELQMPPDHIRLSDGRSVWKDPSK